MVASRNVQRQQHYFCKMLITLRKFPMNSFCDFQPSRILSLSQTGIRALASSINSLYTTTCSSTTKMPNVDIFTTSQFASAQLWWYKIKLSATRMDKVTIEVIKSDCSWFGGEPAKYFSSKSLALKCNICLEGKRIVMKWKYFKFKISQNYINSINTFNPIIPIFLLTSPYSPETWFFLWIGMSEKSENSSKIR